MNNGLFRRFIVYRMPTFFRLPAPYTYAMLYAHNISCLYRVPCIICSEKSNVYFCIILCLRIPIEPPIVHRSFEINSKSIQHSNEQFELCPIICTVEFRDFLTFFLSAFLFIKMVYEWSFRWMDCWRILVGWAWRRRKQIEAEKMSFEIKMNSRR